MATLTHPEETSRTHVVALGTDPALRRRFLVVDEPLRGNLRFGLLLEVLDKVAEEAALAYVRQFHPDARVVTAAIDNILVRHVADLTRDIVLRARINHVGRSSMEVGIRVEHAGEPVVHIASCYFTMVARSTAEEGAKSLALEPLLPASDLDLRRAEKAQLRREAYKRELAAESEPPGREEYEILAAVHRAQEEPGFAGPLAGRLVVDSWERMYPEMENVPRKIFGGHLVRHAYELCSICATRVAPDRPVLAAVNRINFFQPVRIGDTLHYTSRVVYTSGSDICVEASIERTSRDRATSALSNSCLFTFVNVDPDLHPLAVPTVFPTTYAEDARYLRALRNTRALRQLHFLG